MPRRPSLKFDLIEVEKLREKFKTISNIKITTESLLRQLYPELKKAIELGYSFEIIDNMVHDLTKKRIGAKVIKKCFDAFEQEAQKSTEKKFNLEGPKKRGRKPKGELKGELKGEQTLKGEQALKGELKLEQTSLESPSLESPSAEPPSAEGTGPVLADPDLS
jgi:hypothetical protein